MTINVPANQFYSSTHVNSDNHIVLGAAEDLRAAGFALHWLHSREKRPIGKDWSEAPVASLDQLRTTYREGYNLGIRLGEPSRTPGGYLHALDLDIRDDDLADEVWAALADLLPGVDLTVLPTVISGSGGESRHLYFVSDRPFQSKKLWNSQTKFRSEDGRWHYTAEIDLFGTGRQLVLPPSIHPITGKPYQWLRPFEFELLDLGLVEWPVISAALIDTLAVAVHQTYEFETREPLTFTAGQLDRNLDAIPIERLDDRTDWITLGQALHHQFGGSDEGFDLWMKHSRRSANFDPKGRGDAAVLREERRRYRGFGRNRRKPITMASIVDWAKEARVSALRDAFDEEDGDDGSPPPETHANPASREPVGPLSPPPPDPIDAIGDDYDDILGADTPEHDPIDDIGTATAAATVVKPLDWLSLLDVTEEGGIKTTLHNLEMIIANDPRLIGLPQMNEFTQEVVQRRAPGTKPDRRRNPAKQTRQLAGEAWRVRDPVNGDLWSDDRDFAVRSILEAPKTQGGYGIKLTDRDLKAAIVLAASDNRFHPVREYLEALKWDGVSRVEKLFVEYLGAEDTPYSRGVARLMMVGGVTRIFEPGHKADHVVILEGLQGKRKSTFIKVLARHWFAELDADLDDTKQCVEIMQGAFILELPELSGFGKADVRKIKAFVSRQTDKVRLSYARRAGEYPRQCLFIGSTNDRDYLRDDSGGRRWWPIDCTVQQIATDRLEENVDQLWAEALTVYRSMRQAQPHGTLPLYLSNEEASAEALRMQESRRVESADEVLAGQIGAWLDRPIVSGDLHSADEGQMRNETCAAEVWAECLHKEPSSLTQLNSQMIGRALKLTGDWEQLGKYAVHGRYGRQRIWERGGLTGRLARAA